METIFTSKKRIFLPETTSTNSYAIELLKNVNLEEGTLVYTDCQTQGKGQRGMTWNSQPASNLTLSFILKPAFLSLENYFYLYKIAALACYDALTEFINTSQYDIKIKWPNDILVNRKKICGILIENVLFENKINWSVVGIGMNANQELFDAAFNATSIKNILGQEIDRMKLLNQISWHIENNYWLLKQKKYKEIDDKYLIHLFGLKEQLLFEYKGECASLQVIGLNAKGLLMLKNDEGQEITVDVKDIKWKF